MDNSPIDELLEELDRMSNLTFEREERAERVEHQTVQLYNEMEKSDPEDINDADDTSDENRSRFYEHEKRNKGRVKRELIRRHKVLMIRVGYDKQSDDRYFWDCVDIVQSKTGNCKVLVNNIDKSKEPVKQMAEKISYLCEWFPVTLYGYLRSFLYFLRSWFTGILSYYNILNFAPTLVFVDAHPITIPLLKLFFACPIISFGFFDDMLDRNKLTVLPIKARTPPELIRNFCLMRANELLVPSKTIGYKFIKQTKHCSYTPTAFYPPIHGRGGTELTVHTKYYFLIIGPWQKYARMEFAFSACQRFYDYVLDDPFKPLVRFVFIGYMDENDAKAIDYKIRMYKIFQAAKKPFRNCILTFTNPTDSELSAHYRNCVGVMNVTTCDFAWPLLEAVYYGRQVICLGNQFANEIIRHGVNGLLQDSNVNIFAIQINYLFMYAIEEMPSYTAKRLARKYSRSGRKTIIDELLLKYFPMPDNE